MTMLRLTALALPFVTVLAATGASAQDIPCTADTDCAEGQICALTDCARPCDTDVDPTCEPVDCGGGGTCIDAGPPPAECASDADCGSGERCVIETFESCVGCACAADDPACDCDIPTGEECKTETFAFCLQPWQAACAVDADCGGGFTCEFIESCGCSGSGGSEGGDADAAPPAPEDPEACVCEPATEGSCVLERVECASAADCAAGFECIDEGSAGVCSVDEAGTVTCDEPAASASVCAPAGFGGGTGAENGLVRASDDSADDEPVDEVDARNVFACSTSTATSALPLAALALLLRRRRR